MAKQTEKIKMSIITKLHYEELIINILWFNLSFLQESDISGRPSAKPTGGIWRIAFETRKDDPFLEYMVSGTMIKYLKIAIQPAILGGKSRIIELRDVYIINHRDNFDGVNNEPMTTYIELSPASMVQNGQTIFEKYWKVTDLSANVTPTTKDNSPELIRYYITDLEGNELEKYESSDKILLNLETKNAIGEKLTVKIPDKTYDFKHNGITLQNDTLKDYLINNDLEKVELEVVEQQE